MDTTNGLKQAQVRSPQTLVVGKCNNDGGTRLNGRRERVRDSCQHTSEKSACVFCDAEEPRAATQQTRCHRTLERIWGAVQGQAGRDRGRGKAVISQRDEHSLEHTHLLRRRSLLCGEPESQLAKPDVPNQLAREIVTKQVNAGDIRRTDPGGIFHLFSLYVKSLVPLRVDVWRLAEPGANLFVILAERRRWQLVARRRPGERNRVTNHWHDIIPRANLDNWIESDFVGERNPPFNIVDRAARHTCCAQSAKPLICCSGAQPFNQQRAQSLAIAGAIPGVRKPGIMRQLRKVENLAEFAELPIIPGSDS